MREKTDETKGFEETLGDYFCPKYSSGVFQSCRSEESGRFFFFTLFFMPAEKVIRTECRSLFARVVSNFSSLQATDSAITGQCVTLQES